MQIDVSKVKNIKGGLLDFDLTEQLDAASYGYPELIFAEPLRFWGQVENSERGLMVRGQAQGVLLLNCSRCLTDFRSAFAVELTELFTNRPEILAEDAEDTIYPFSGSSLDLTPCLLKAIYLSLPMQLLCQPDCRGLCVTCGKNLNEGACDCQAEYVDPRLAQLAQFQSEKGE